MVTLKRRGVGGLVFLFVVLLLLRCLFQGFFLFGQFGPAAAAGRVRGQGEPDRLAQVGERFRPLGVILRRGGSEVGERRVRERLATQGEELSGRLRQRVRVAGQRLRVG